VAAAAASAAAAAIEGGADARALLEEVEGCASPRRRKKITRREGAQDAQPRRESLRTQQRPSNRGERSRGDRAGAPGGSTAEEAMGSRPRATGPRCLPSLWETSRCEARGWSWPVAVAAGGGVNAHCHTTCCLNPLEAARSVPRAGMQGGVHTCRQCPFTCHSKAPASPASALAPPAERRWPRPAREIWLRYSHERGANASRSPLANFGRRQTVVRPRLGESAQAGRPFSRAR